jgi:hypothetical protein
MFVRISRIIYLEHNFSKGRVRIWFFGIDSFQIAAIVKWPPVTRLLGEPQYPAAWPNGRSLPVVLQSDPQGRFPKNGRCITEGRSRGDCSYLSELQSPNDPGRPSRNTETTERKSDLQYNDRSGALARQ